jgi:hypothetical protein
MTPTEQRYSAQEREMLAVVYALHKWHSYIEGSPVLVCTDHESLKHFLTQRHLGRRLACFVDDIAHFDVEIMYRPGRNQLVADTLSRRQGHDDIPDSETLKPLFAGVMDAPKHEGLFCIYSEYEQRLQQGEDPQAIGNGTYLIIGDVLHRRIKNQWGADIEVEVPTSPDKAEEVVQQLHHDMGHLGVLTLLAALHTRFSIPYVRKVVEKVVVTTKRVYFIFRLLFITCTITVGHMTDASSLSHMTHYESFLGLHFPYDSI